jgi:hypothetical protein
MSVTDELIQRDGDMQNQKITDFGHQLSAAFQRSNVICFILIIHHGKYGSMTESLGTISSFASCRNKNHESRTNGSQLIV